MAPVVEKPDIPSNRSRSERSLPRSLGTPPKLVHGIPGARPPPVSLTAAGRVCRQHPGGEGILLRGRRYEGLPGPGAWVA